MRLFRLFLQCDATLLRPLVGVKTVAATRMKSPAVAFGPGKPLLKFNCIFQQDIVVERNHVGIAVGCQQVTSKPTKDAFVVLWYFDLVPVFALPVVGSAIRHVKHVLKYLDDQFLQSLIRRIGRVLISKRH